jgi:hypothetical protein
MDYEYFDHASMDDDDDDQDQGTAGPAVQGSMNPGVEAILPMIREIVRAELQKLMTNSNFAQAVGNGQPSAIPPSILGQSNQQPPNPTGPSMNNPSMAPSVHTGPNPTGPSMSRRDWQEQMRPFCADQYAQDVDSYINAHPEHGPAISQAISDNISLGYAQDHFSSLVTDRSESNPVPASETRTIISNPAITDQSIRGLAAVILGGNEGVTTAVQAAVSAGLPQGRNWALIISEWLGVPVPSGPDASFPTQEDLRSMCYAICHMEVESTASLVLALKNAVRLGMQADPATVRGMVQALGAKPPTPMTLNGQQRYRINE